MCVGGGLNVCVWGGGLECVCVCGGGDLNVCVCGGGLECVCVCGGGGGAWMRVCVGVT